MKNETTTEEKKEVAPVYIEHANYTATKDLVELFNKHVSEEPICYIDISTILNLADCIRSEQESEKEAAPIYVEEIKLNNGVFEFINKNVSDEAIMYVNADALIGIIEDVNANSIKQNEQTSNTSVKDLKEEMVKTLLQEETVEEEDVDKYEDAKFKESAYINTALKRIRATIRNQDFMLRDQRAEITALEKSIRSIEDRIDNESDNYISEMIRPMSTMHGSEIRTGYEQFQPQQPYGNRATNNEHNPFGSNEPYVHGVIKPFKMNGHGTPYRNNDPFQNFNNVNVNPYTGNPNNLNTTYIGDTHNTSSENGTKLPINKELATLLSLRKESDRLLNMLMEIGDVEKIQRIKILREMTIFSPAIIHAADNIIRIAYNNYIYGIITM